MKVKLIRYFAHTGYRIIFKAGKWSVYKSDPVLGLSLYASDLKAKSSLRYLMARVFKIEVVYIDEILRNYEENFTGFTA
jgi:hypothetical protein